MVGALTTEKEVAVSERSSTFAWIVLFHDTFKIIRIVKIFFQVLKWIVLSMALTPIVLLLLLLLFDTFDSGIFYNSSI